MVAATQTRTPPPYRTVNADGRADLERHLFRLWDENFNRDWQGWYEWMFRDNPYGSIANWFVEANDTDEVVGSTALMPRPLSVHGEEVSSGQALHINVLRQHRSAAPALQLQRALIQSVEERDARIVCGVTATAGAIMKRVGYRHIADVERWILPMRGDFLVRKKIQSPLLRRPLGLAVDCALRTRPLWQSANRSTQGTFCTLESFDDRFDAFWAKMRERFPVIGPRDSQFLQWRFANKPDSPCRIVCHCDRTGEVDGYTVLSTFDDPTERVKYLAVHDLIASDDRILAALLRQTARAARRLKVDAISVLYAGSSELPQLLKRFGFVQRPYDWKVYVYFSPQFERTDELCDENAWYLTEAELEL